MFFSFKYNHFLSKNTSEKGFKFIVITNQAGIATKDLTDRTLEDIHKKMITKLKKLNIEIIDIFVSKDHWQSNNFRRKPNPGMFFEASSKHLFRSCQNVYPRLPHEDKIL